MADVHTRAARASGAVVTSITSSTPESTRRAASRLRIPTPASSLEEILTNPQIDVVHVCTPNATHAAIAAAVIDAGKHVVCEKPLATNSADAQFLTDAARNRGLVATVPFVYRFHPMVREARARVADGSTGPLLTLVGTYVQDWLLLESDTNWRVDDKAGGPSRAFADIGSHLVDLIEFITGDRITRLLATTRTVFHDRPGAPNITTEDLAGVLFQTRNATVGTLLVSQLAPGRKNGLTIEIHGTQETLRFDQERPETLWIGRRRGSQQLMRNAEELHEDAARLCAVPAGHPQGYQDAFNAFANDTYAAIAGQTPPGLPTFADGLRANIITEAVLQSANTHTWTESIP